MKVALLIISVFIYSLSYSQLPSSGKVKVYKIQSNYVSGTPSSSSLSGDEGIGIFDADGLLLKKVTPAALGLPTGTVNRIAKFTGTNTLGNATLFTDSLGFYGLGQVDGSGLGTAKLNITTQGNSSASMGLVIKNSSNSVIGQINNAGGFVFGSNSLTWDDANVKLTASAPFQFGTFTNHPVYFITDNTIRTALDATAFTSNVPVDNTADSYTGLARGTTAQRPTATGSRVRYNSDSLWYEGADGSNFELFASRNWVRANFSGGSATTIYNGDGTLSGNRTVTGSNNDLTFAGIDLFTVNSNYSAQAKNDGTRIYTSAIGLSSANYWQFAYTPSSAGSFTRGNAIVVDTLNNVGLGDVTQTTMPLYTTGNSTYIPAGLQSRQGNFYSISNITTNTTLGITDNFVTIDATAGNLTITLPAASAAFGFGMGLDLVFKRLDNSGNTVTVQRAGSDTIDGANSFTLTTQWEAKRLRALSTSTWGLY